MSQFTINGNETEVPVSPEATVKELLETLRHTLTTDTSLIESILIDGIEISSASDSADPLNGVSLKEIHSIVVRTTHPKEFANETITNLIAYASELEKMSRDIAEGIRSGERTLMLTPLVDGIKTFTDGIQAVKNLLKLGNSTSLCLIEADLLSILSDTLEYQRAGRAEYVAEMLSDHLPLNLAEWRESGLITLMRARDS